MSNTLRYKGLSLSINAIYNLGHVMRQDVNRMYTLNRLAPGCGSISSDNINADFDNRWKQVGDETWNTFYVIPFIFF